MIEYPSDVTLVEMLPRDGFQRLDEFVPTDEKVEIIDALSRLESTRSRSLPSPTRRRSRRCETRTRSPNASSGTTT